ncbi:MAG: type 4a pilus biogenesis protein PilO [Acidobacteria bacterium]|nr:type 4a pilus biogenesis protein PilO [Acidobacteriota bacterium]
MPSIRDMSAPVQIMIALLVGVAIVAAGLYAPYSPVQSLRAERDQAQADKASLEAEVIPLRVYRSRLATLQAEMASQEKTLETLRTIVPEEKEIDEFVRQVHGAAVSSRVEIRKMVAKDVIVKDYHSEMPFEVSCDGPYYSVLDFFGRMGRLSRIINVGDLTFASPAKDKTNKYPLTPGTTVTGKFIATTFFTKREPGEGPAKAPGKAPAATPAPAPAKAK